MTLVLRQMYYTSCENGLSGFAGFQFNAVSPGVPPDVMRTVEVLSAYEPPRSMTYSDDAADLDRCPVNLTFAPGDRVTVLSQVVYVGQDFSRRYGNYFVHALATDDPDPDLAGLLPIEYWRASWWEKAPADGAELPVLTQISRGGLDRARVAAFLTTHPHRRGLGALLASVVGCLTGTGSSILVVDGDSDAIATWIAAVSYLLPADLARRISFATYQRRPVPGRLHVYGTVAEILSEPGQLHHDLPVHDFGAGTAPDGAVPPWAELLTRVGVERAGAVWSRVTHLAGNMTIGDCHPILAAAAAELDVTLSADDASAAVAWLGSAANRLDRHVVAALGARLLDDTPADALAALAAIGRAIGVESLVEDAQQRAATAQLDAVLRGEPRGEVVKVDTVAVRQRLAERCSNLVTTLSAHRGLDVLSWAIDADVPVDPDAVADCGEAIAPHLDTLPRTPLLDTARRLPGLRFGVVRCYARLAADNRSYADAAMAGVLAEVLGEEDVAAHETLAQAWLIVSARRDPERTVESLVRVARPAGTVVVDEDLLARLRPDGWSAVDLDRLVAAIDAGRLPVAAVTLTDLIDMMLDRKPTDDDLSALLELARRLTRSPTWTALVSRWAQQELAELLAVERELGSHDQARLRARMRDVGKRCTAVQTFVRIRVTPRVIAAASSVREIAELLGGATPQTVCEHLAAVRRQLGRPVDALLRIRVAGVVLAKNAVPPERVSLYEGIVDDIARVWSWPDLDQLCVEVRGVNPKYAHNVMQWLEHRGRPTRKERAKDRARQKKDRGNGRAAPGGGRARGWLLDTLGFGDGRPPDPDLLPPPVPPPDR